jgi:hypothetical protein
VVLRTFRWSFIVTGVALVAALLYGGWTAVTLAVILGVLEVSLSFDNAVVNAKVLERMSPFWQKMFLTVGIAIAVFGMRLLFPLIIVGVTAKLGPVEAINLAMAKGDPNVAGTYGYLLNAAHPQIAAFGGMFLLMLFLDFIFEGREITWLSWLERPLARIGKLDQLSVVVSGIALVLSAELLAHDPAAVLVSGVLGMVTYLAVNGLGTLFESGGSEDDDDSSVDAGELAGIHGDAAQVGRSMGAGASDLVKAVGKAGFFLFLYLEVLDASFSFDGVIGAFAITSDPIIIAIGLGLIGAMYVRSITVLLVRKGTLNDYVYLEHGAHWAIGALSVILLVSIGVRVDEIITGLVGVAFIGAALLSSLARNKREAAQDPASGRGSASEHAGQSMNAG